jgi:hypothetical protein
MRTVMALGSQDTSDSQNAWVQRVCWTHSFYETLRFLNTLHTAGKRAASFPNA